MEEYKTVLKKYTEFNGRARRREYWMFTLVNVIIIILLALIDGFLRIKILHTIYILAILIPSIAVTVRRLHDTGRSGWWIFISIIPLIGSIVLLVFECLDSQPGDNQYGPNPKGVPNSTMTPPPIQM